MSMNLMIQTANPVDASVEWAAITAIAPEGLVMIEDKAVTLLAQLLDGTKLANGEIVTGYAMEEDDCMSSLVSAFGPCLLPADKIDAIRVILADVPKAIEILDLTIERKLQISFNGSESHLGAHVKGVNWAADEVEINRSGGSMLNMLEDLGIPVVRGTDMGEVAFDVFAKAVNDNEVLSERVLDRLEQFVACGRRNGAVKVYWA